MPVSSVLRSKVRAVLEECATEMLADMQQLLSVQVGREGRRVIARSKPGEAPRKDRGSYRDGFEVSVDQSRDDRGRFTSALSINLSNPTANGLDRKLEKGTKNMAARPHFSVIIAKWTPRVRSRLTQATQT